MRMQVFKEAELVVSHIRKAKERLEKSEAHMAYLKRSGESDRFEIRIGKIGAGGVGSRIDKETAIDFWGAVVAMEKVALDVLEDRLMRV